MLAGGMTQSAGKADPFWYEWNVGLEKIIEMLQPDTDVASVEFQRDGIKGWDDVVVRFTDGRTDYYQVKHSRVGASLTFGSLVTVQEGSSLLGSLFDAWKQLGAGRDRGRFFLFTNREAGSHASKSESGVTLFRQSDNRIGPIYVFELHKVQRRRVLFALGRAADKRRGAVESRELLQMIACACAVVTASRWPSNCSLTTKCRSERIGGSFS